MNRVPITLLSVLFLAAGMAPGQTVQTRIYTEPTGATFYVDGTKYTSSATFMWPKGSRHTIWADVSQNTGLTTRMAFGGWKDDGSLLQAATGTYLTILADPNVTAIKGTFTVEHRVDVLVSTPSTPTLPELSTVTVPCPADPTGAPVPGTSVFSTTTPGAVFIDGQCTAQSVSVWKAAGGLMVLNAFPARGYVFNGWIVNGDVANDSYLRNFTVNGPSVISPRFSPGKRVVFQTEPYGLNITIDRAVIPTRDPTDNLPYIYPPWEFFFADGSSHILGAPPSQYDLSGKMWVLDSFSIGGGEGTIYKAVGANIPETINAKFVRGTAVSLLTNPLGVRLSVDGREWPSYNFVWGVGSKHAITAPAEATDAKGRKYKFTGWAQGGPAAIDFTTPEETDAGGVRLVANYEIYPRLVVSAAQPGSKLQVDGAVCPLPCTLDRPIGASVTLSVAESIAMGADSRMQFDGWNDSAPATRTFNFTGLDRQLAFRYKTFNRLLALSDPPEGATFRIEPASGDGFYPSDSAVQVTAVPNEGYKFRRWDGDLAGTSSGGFVSMQVPRLVRAQLDKTPFISSTGVRNAAGETPLKAVAPGSIVSIYGAGLANDYVAGAAGPLTQTLGNVTARIGNRLLPLLFVSPEQVNAYLPSDIADGEYTIAVRNGAMPEIAGKVTIVRNAPGVFGQLIGEQFVATAQRPDGSLAAPDKPAKRGEQVVLMGTGFGALQRFVLDGFPAAESPPNPLRTPAQIVLGDAEFNPDFAGAAPGLVGVTLIRFTIPADWPTGPVEVRVRQAGVESNKVVLPVE
ncbi:MAG: hypothetical protein HYX27_11860 [Acidobacteria bacterium]|nr:hypothetical protein [Acidobacteriota bacterium]